MEVWGLSELAAAVETIPASGELTLVLSHQNLSKPSLPVYGVVPPDTSLREVGQVRSADLIEAARELESRIGSQDGVVAVLRFLVTSAHGRYVHVQFGPQLAVGIVVSKLSEFIDQGASRCEAALEEWRRRNSAGPRTPTAPA